MKFKRDLEVSTLYQVKFYCDGAVGVKKCDYSCQCNDT
jgi:hypothetical protein